MQYTRVTHNCRQETNTQLHTHIHRHPLKKRISVKGLSRKWKMLHMFLSPNCPLLLTLHVAQCAEFKGSVHTNLCKLNQIYVHTLLDTTRCKLEQIVCQQLTITTAGLQCGLKSISLPNSEGPHLVKLKTRGGGGEVFQQVMAENFTKE